MALSMLCRDGNNNIGEAMDTKLLGNPGCFREKQLQTEVNNVVPAVYTEEGNVYTGSTDPLYCLTLNALLIE